MTNHRIILLRLLIGICLSVWLIPLAAQSLSLRSYADPSTVGRDEVVSFSIEITADKRIRISAPQLPNLKDFSLRNMATSSASSFSFGSGGVSETVTKVFTYNLIPKRTGSLTIPALNLKVDGKSYQTQPVSIRVLNQPYAGRTPAGGGNQGFGQGLPLFDTDPFNMNFGFEPIGEVSLIALPEKRTVFLGEPLIVTYKLYTAQMVSSLELVEEKDQGGYGKATYSEPTRLNFETVNYKGQRYQAATIKTLVISPNRSGEIQVPRLTVQAQTGNMSLFTKTLSNDIVQIKVLPLPETGKPNDFTGAVGNFKLTDRLLKPVVRLGEAFEYSVTISGKGNFNQFSNPEYPEMDGFRIASPLTDDRLQAGISGTRTIRYLIIPKQEGKFSLPGISFNWFDPLSQSYQTYTGKPMQVVVKPGNVLTYLSNVFQKDNQLSLSPYAPRTAYRHHSIWVTRFLYWLLISVILLAFIPSWLIARHNRLKELDPDLAAQKGSARVLRKYLKQAALSAQNASREFYPQAETGIMHYLSDKYHIPHRYSIPEKLYQLRLKGIPEELVMELEAFLKRCQEARYMPGGFDAAILSADLSVLKKVINGFISLQG